jgi:hypothetical protein
MEIAARPPRTLRQVVFAIKYFTPFIVAGARWPIFRPNNSEQSSTNLSWPGKIGSRKMAEFCIQVTETETFLQLFRSKNIELFVVYWQKLLSF